MKYLYYLLFAGALGAQTQTPSQTTAPERKDAIIVTGTYEAIPLDEADRAVDQVPVRAQSLLFGNVVDALKLDPSLDLRQRSPGGTQADLSIRGSSTGQTLVLINGMRVNDAQTAHHNLNLTTPLNEVQSVEILRGAGSSLYGSDAVGGVVNIVTTPPESTEFRFRSAIGSAGTNAEGGSLAGGGGGLGAAGGMGVAGAASGLEGIGRGLMGAAGAAGRGCAGA